MFVTIKRSRIDPHRLYGLIVAESETLVAIQRECDFQFDGFIFIRKRDITHRIEGTESQRYHESLMRKEGFWKLPPKFVRNLPLESWNVLLLALVDKPVVLENERNGENWFGVVKVCTRTAVSIHRFSPMGIFDEALTRVPLRSITAVQYGDRYTTTQFKYLKHPSET